MGKKKNEEQKEWSKKFGKRLNLLRVLHGMSQRELARKIGMKNNYNICNYETGRVSPSFFAILQFKKAFGLKSLDMFDPESEITFE